MKKKLQVFISSTYTDLSNERQAAVEAILSAGHIPAGMELFSASSESQLEVIKRWISESDVFLLILGGRYGSIELNTQKSYIQLEYEYALEIGIPFFSIIIKEETLDKKVQSLGKGVLELENPEAYKKFKEIVQSKLCKFFEDAKDIKLAVYETLSDFEKRYNMSGWISGKDIKDIENYVNEISVLIKENRELKNHEKKLLEEINKLGKEQKKSINNNQTESLAIRVERIFELMKSEEQYSDNLTWIEGEGEEEIEYLAPSPRGDFNAYFFYEENGQTIKYIGLLYIDDGNSTLHTTVLADIRLMLDDYKTADDTMNYKFILASMHIDEETEKKCYEFFKNAMMKVGLHKSERFELEIWGAHRLLEIEKDLGLIY